MSRPQDFWQFFALRQEAYWRHRKGEGPPYSDDPALARYHFCNVYREGDKMTRWFHDHHSGDTLQQSIFYRPVNRLETFKAWAGDGSANPRGTDIPTWNDKKPWLAFLQKRMDAGERCFTGRHLTRGVVNYADTLNWADEHEEALRFWLSRAKSRSEACDALRELPYIGPFFAWQILCDLLENDAETIVCPPAVREDDWALLGPGARRVAFLIDADANPLDTARALRDNQPGDLPAPPPDTPGPVSLKNIEHALCEYARYVAVMEGKGRLEVKPWA